jgi:sucrose phosphorylase
MNNKVHLIAYADRLCEDGLKGILDLLRDEFNELFGGIHILPFYYPIDGTDAGFDPIDHEQVDSRIGSWEDIEAIGRDCDVMADLIVNHISALSTQFKNYLTEGANSPYKDLFLSKEDIFGFGHASEDIRKIYRPRPTSPFTNFHFSNGESKEMWTTFSPNQVDIHTRHKLGRAYIYGIIDRLAQNGVSLIRLDAVGYSVKKAGTSCFMIPETYQFIDDLCEYIRSKGMSTLVEVHSYYETQIKIAKHADLVYDFALPPLVLHALFKGTNAYLKKWMDIRPFNSINVLDTHDGIGVIDIGHDSSTDEKEGLLPEKEIADLISCMHENTGGISRKATGEGANNLDIYQINSTFYDVLAQNDDAYILARAVQFYLPGIPQVYYVGFLGEPNDITLFEETQVGRDINRHFFTKTQIGKCLKRPVVKRLIELIRYRNECPAFQGDFSYWAIDSSRLKLSWTSETVNSSLHLDFKTKTFEIEDSSNHTARKIRF